MNDDDDGDDNDVYCLSRKIIIACVQSMKCDNLFIDSCPVCCISQSDPFVHFGCGSVCVCVIYRLLNASVFSVSDPSDALFSPV